MNTADSGENMDKQGKRFTQEADEINKSTDGAVKHDEKRSEREQRLKDKNAKKLEKLMRKQRRRERQSRRDVLSYEDMPLKEREEASAPRKSKWNKKQIFFAIVIVIVLFGVVFFAANPDKFSVHNIVNFFNYGLMNRNSDESFPLDIQGESISTGNFVRRGQDICFSSDTKTQLLNNYGRSVYKVQHAFINPVLCVGSEKTLVYNLGGTGYQVIDPDGTVFSADMDENILVADVNDHGTYALVTQSSGYLSKLYVYDEDHTQIFAYSFADYYITSVSLGANGKQAVVSGLSALDGADIASLYVLDFTRDTPLYFQEIEDNIFYDVRYLNDKYACAVGRSLSCVINTYTGNIETFSYEGNLLTAYDINTDTDTYTLSLSNSGDGRNCDIVSFGANGKVSKTFRVEDRVNALSTYKGRVALLNDNSILLYSKDGGKVSEKDLRSDCHGIVLYTGSDAYVLCTGYIDSVSM